MASAGKSAGGGPTERLADATNLPPTIQVVAVSKAKHKIAIAEKYFSFRRKFLMGTKRTVGLERKEKNQLRLNNRRHNSPL